MNEALRKTLKQLRLSGLLVSLEIRLQEAAGHGLSHGEFLELILQDELAVRGDRQLERRFKAAQFRERKSLEDFDWSFNPSIPRRWGYRNPLFVGECKHAVCVTKWVSGIASGIAHLESRKRGFRLPSLTRRVRVLPAFRGWPCADTQRAEGVTLQSFQDNLLITYW
jgi:hypothetical protein